MFMTGSNLMRRAVPQMTTLRIDNTFERSPVLANHIKCLRNLINSFEAQSWNENHWQTHIALCARSSLKSMKLSIEGGLEAERFFDQLRSSDTPFGSLEELVLSHHSHGQFFHEELAKIFPKTLTRLSYSGFKMTLKTLPLLPKSIVDLEMMLFRPCTWCHEDEEEEVFEYHLLCGPKELFPDNLTRLSITLTRHVRILYKALPESLTDLKIVMRPETTSADPNIGSDEFLWACLPPRLVFLEVFSLDMSESRALCLPRCLKSLIWRGFRKNWELSAIEALPRNLVYLELDPLRNDCAYATVSDLLDALPPSLTGFSIHKLIPFHCRTSLSPTLESCISKDEIRAYIANLPMIGEDSEQARENEFFLNSQNQRLQLEFTDSTPKVRSTYGLRSKNIGEDLEYARWSVPERFQNISFWADYSPGSFLVIPKAAKYLYINNADINMQFYSSARIREWKQATEYFKTQLTGLKHLVVDFKARIWQGILDDCNIEWESIEMPIAMVTVRTSFPNSLKSFKDSSIILYPSLSATNVCRSIPSTIFLENMSQKLHTLRVGPNMRFSGSDFSRLPESLTSLLCCTTGVDLEEDHFTDLPKGLKDIAIYCSKILFVPISSRFSAAMPHPMESFSIVKETTRASIGTESGTAASCCAQTEEFFQKLPKAFLTFQVGPFDILAERQKDKHKVH